jgi:hypothetical protein
METAWKGTKDAVFGMAATARRGSRRGEYDLCLMDSFVPQPLARPANHADRAIVEAGRRSA